MTHPSPGASEVISHVVRRDGVVALVWLFCPRDYEAKLKENNANDKTDVKVMSTCRLSRQDRK